MRFLRTFLGFLKLISSLKAQVCNILKNYVEKKFFNFKTYLKKLYSSLLVFTDNIFINKPSGTGRKILQTVPKLPSNDEITRFDGMQ
jgi:hypothetical protein